MAWLNLVFWLLNGPTQSEPAEGGACILDGTWFGDLNDEESLMEVFLVKSDLDFLDTTLTLL